MMRLNCSYDGASTAAQLEGPALFTNAGGAVPSTSPTPRTGAKCLSTFLPFGIPTLLSPGGSQSGGTIGTGFNAATAFNRQVMAFLDSGTPQIYVIMRHLVQTLQIWRYVDGFTPVLLAETVAPINFLSWYFIELECTIHPSTGIVKLYVNNELVVNLTGQNTRSTANSTFNQFQLGAASEGVFAYDDTYFLDNVVGDGCVSALGDSRCVALFAVPDATELGDFGGSTPSTGSDRGAVVDDTSPNDDTDFNTLDPGDKDSYHHDQLPVGVVQVLAVGSRQRVRKTDAGVCTLESRMRIGGSSFSVGSTIYPGVTYQPQGVGSLGQSPATTSAWGIAEVNGMQTEIERTA